MRIVSFRFDDGLWEGAKKAHKILYPHKGSFFIVRDWLSNVSEEIDDKYNNERYHGSIDEWQAMSLSGHDIQAHSCSHSMFSKLDLRTQANEFEGSLECIKKIHNGPYIFCFPYNDIISADLESIGYAASGFITRSSKSPIIYNDLTKKIWHNLNSWAIRQAHIESIKLEVENLPDDSWVILSLHSLDGEGFEPWDSTSFEDLVRSIEKMGFGILSISEVLNLYSN